MILPPLVFPGFTIVIFDCNDSANKVRWCNVDGQNVACFDVECHLHRILLGKALMSTGSNVACMLFSAKMLGCRIVLRCHTLT